MTNDQLSPRAATSDVPLMPGDLPRPRPAHDMPPAQPTRPESQVRRFLMADGGPAKPVRPIPVTTAGGGRGDSALLSASSIQAPSAPRTSPSSTRARAAAGCIPIGAASDTSMGSAPGGTTRVCTPGWMRWSRVRNRHRAARLYHGIQLGPGGGRRFSAVDLTGLDDQASFYDALASQLGMAQADRFCSLTGYEAIRDHRFPVVGGLDLISTHPEAFGSAAHRSAWVAPAAGFTGLVDALRDYLAARGVTMLRSTRLVAAETSSRGLDLDLLTNERCRLHLVTERLVLAIPPAELLSLCLPVHPRTLGWLPQLVVSAAVQGVPDLPRAVVAGFRPRRLLLRDR